MMASAAVPAFLVLTSCILLTDRSVQAYSTGAGVNACDYTDNSGNSNSLIPGHGVPPQNSPSPFQIQILSNNNVNYNNRQPIELSLTRSGAGPRFKGFLLVAMDGEGNLIGNFQTIITTQSSYTQPRCGGTSITHTAQWHSATDESILLRWTPPRIDQWTGFITFMGTFVQTKDVFWARVEGAVQVSLPAEMSAGVTPPPGWEPTTTGPALSLPALVETTPKIIETTTSVPEATTTTAAVVSTSAAIVPTPAAAVVADVTTKLEQTSVKDVSSDCSAPTVECLRRKIVSQIHFLVADLEKLKAFIDPASIGSISSRK